MLVRLATSAADRALCLSLRRAVFIDEQGVPEALELDGEDDDCVHVIAVDDGRPVGTARLKFLGGDVGKAQRVAVDRSVRSQGIGRLVMGAIEEEARRRGCRRLKLSSQVTAVPFYERLGYVASGPVYDDAGIPHRDMARDL